MPSSTSEDLSFGLASENRNIGIIEKLVGCALQKDANNYSSFDFHNSDRTVFAELKSRRIRHNQYPTTIISADKLLILKKARIIILFGLTWMVSIILNMTQMFGQSLNAKCIVALTALIR